MRVTNRCSKPPFGLEWQVRRSLRWLDRSHLEGLAEIRLEDELPKWPVTGEEVEWVQRIRVEGHTAYVNGWYAMPTASEPPFIILYAQPVYRPIPSFLWWSTVPTIRILRTLAHEVAHHLIATRGYVFKKEEDLSDEEMLANRYAESVLRKAAAQWSYKLGQWCLKDIAGWHYAFAMVDWRQKKYKAAAERFYNAWNLDPENEAASRWYWRAKEMCSSES